MTTRLYWQDPYQTEFVADVLESLVWQDQASVILDKTCFYATSGGQPHYIGTLGTAHVIDVVEDQGRIIHLLDRPMGADTVQGIIDWPRRFDHMQQHSGQHILSQAFEQLLGLMTVSFHLGAETCTIDVDGADITAEQVAQIEDLSNQIIAENRTISVQQVDESDLGRFQLRKAPQVHGRVRIVTVDDFDQCACGGTHVQRAGEIGSIHVRRWEHRRDVLRIEFLCGWRALRDYRMRDGAVQELARHISVKIEELADALIRLEKAEANARHRADRLRRRLLESELPHFVEQLQAVNDWQLLVCLLDGYDVGNMRYIAQHLVSEPNRIALLAVSDPSPQICFACSESVELDMGHLLRQAAAPYGGRGGGRPHIAQGGGVAEKDLPKVLAQARRLLTVD